MLGEDYASAYMYMMSNELVLNSVCSCSCTCGE